MRKAAAAAAGAAAPETAGPVRGKARDRKREAAAAGTAGEAAAAEAGAAPARAGGPGGAARKGAPGRKPRKKVARFDAEGEPRRKKRSRLERMRRAGMFGVPGRATRPKRKKVRDELVRPSPPLEQTDPLKHYLAGEMVPCPVGCGGFSEIVRVSTMENGGGEIWFECLSCAQRRMFEMAPATLEERRTVFANVEQGQEANCPRHTKPVQMRRRGRDLVCPECGVAFQEPA